jgi:hypothetical protein
MNKELEINSELDIALATVEELIQWLHDNDLSRTPDKLLMVIADTPGFKEALRDTLESKPGYTILVRELGKWRRLVQMCGLVIEPDYRSRKLQYGVSINNDPSLESKRVWTIEIDIPDETAEGDL